MKKINFFLDKLFMEEVLKTVVALRETGNHQKLAQLDWDGYHLPFQSEKLYFLTNGRD